jgi:hypothetical protein
MQKQVDLEFSSSETCFNNMETKVETVVIGELKVSLSYSNYRALIDNLLLQNRTTGTNQSEGYVEYTKQNVHRMNRMEQWLVLPDNLSTKYKRQLRFIVLSEGWCGDASQNLPVIAGLASQLPNITLEIILRDENIELMDKFLTNGGRAIPKLLIVDPATNRVLASWGPRPKEAQDIVIDMKKRPDFDHDEMAKEIFKWYAKDKGKSVLRELQLLLQSLN